MARNSLSDIGKYMSLALMLPIGTAVGYALGYGLDSLFHTHWIRWPFLVFGFAAGIFDLLYELDKDKSQ
ncbi:MAG TPA: AtpZ/AtpI family protein [Bryobacteraceae bacterium]|nr:AtpZ/AtpI family protein [Bryobacteraceae bacterium]